MIPHPKSSNIPYHLIIVFFLLAIGIGITGYLYYNSQKQHIKDEKQADLLAIAELKASQITGWRKERMDQAVDISKDIFCISAIRQFLENPGSTRLRQEILEFMKHLQNIYKYKSVLIVDRNGVIRLSATQREQPLSQHAKKLVEEALRTEQPVFSDIHMGTAVKYAHIDLIIPLILHNGYPARPVGAIVVHISPEEFLYPFLQTWPSPSKTSETLLVEREGENVLYLNELRHKKNTALTLRLPISRKEYPAALAVVGKEGIAEGFDYRDVRVLAAMRAIPDSPWFLIAKVDAEEINEPVRERAWQVALFVAILIITAGLSIGLIWRHQQTGYFRRQYAAEMERLALEQRYAYLSKYANDIILQIDSEGKIVEANERAVASYGYSRDELLKLNIRTLRAPETLSALETHMRDAKEQKELIFETVHIRKDGTIFPVEVSTRVIEDQSKNFFLSIIRDITERKRAEEFLNNIFESMDEGLAVMDREYRIVSANKAYCKHSHINPEDIKGRHCYEIAHKSEKPCYELGEDCSVKHTFDTGQPHAILHTHYDDEGIPVYVETKSYPIKDASGKVMSVIEMVNDITDKKRLEEQLHHAQKMEAIGQLVGGIAHDFNNILTAIIGYTTMIQMKMGKDHLFKANLENILASADRAANLIKSLLAFSRKQLINLRPVKLNQTIRNAEKFLTRIIGEDIELRTVLKEQDLIVRADGFQIEQVLMNLATNARDAMPAGGTFTIETQLFHLDNEFIMSHGFGEPGEYALLVITDTGMGMDNKTKEKIFEPFFTTKEIGKGTGLGLSMVYGIIKQHNGYINVYSEPGKGTSFKMYLPIIKSEVDDGEQADRGIPIRGTETVLLAEDNVEVKLVTQLMLKDFGYNVIAAGDGEEAIEKFMNSKDNIQLLLLDVIMPRKNGREAYEEIKKIKPDIKVLFTSGYTGEVIRERGTLYENFPFLLKPVLPQELSRKIREVLDG